MSIEPVLTGGSRETLLFAQRLARPWLHLHPAMDWRAALRDWLSATLIEALNVAGPRGSREPEIAAFTWTVLDELQRSLASTSQWLWEDDGRSPPQGLMPRYAGRD